MRTVSAALPDGRVVKGQRDFAGKRTNSKMQGDLSSSAQLARYRELARAASSLLDHCGRLPVVALSAMNPRHPLPTGDIELSNSLESGRAMPGMATIIKAWARCVVNALRETMRLLRLKWTVGPFPKEVSGRPAEVVMKTWVFGGDALANGADFYYGTLPQMLERRGISSVLLCGDALGGAAEDGIFARKALAQKQVRYIPEKMLVPLWAPLLMACNQLITSLKLRRLGQKSSDRKFSTVSAYACLECLRPYTTATGLYFYIARAAVKIWTPQVFMTLYEGQPWEKPSWLGSKAADQNCLTVGYQHTVVMPHSLSLISPNNGSWKPQTPDCVLCLGEAPMAMMKPGHGSNGTRFVPFGSFRRAPDESMPRSPKPHRRTVVVVPEGLVSESKLLFNFALRLAPLVPNYRVIFRCHPMLPFDNVRPYLERVPENIPNVEISTGPIEEDFSRSSVVLYRGSSSVLYAVLYGLRPVYLDDDLAPEVDPLFDLQCWRERVSSAAGAVELLSDYERATEESAAKEWRGAAEYVGSYAPSVDDGSVERFLAAVGLS